MKQQSVPQETKNFKFRFTPTMIVLSIVVILLCFVGIGLSVFRIAKYGIHEFTDTLKSPFLIAICVFGIVVVVATLIRSRYTITKETLTMQFGFIKNKFAVKDLSSVLLDTDTHKLTVYMGEQFFVVTTSPEWNNDFVQALREVKPDLEFRFTLAEGQK